MITGQNRSNSDCWKRIGVQGDGSCPELKQYVHCRNCPVYSAAATRLLDRPLPSNYLHEWTVHYSGEKRAEGGDTKTTFIFRVAGEWLALPPVLLLEILEMRPVHSLPHRRNGVVSGLVNVRGGLFLCISLAALLGLEPAKEPQRSGRSRLLVLNRDESHFAFPVDEVHGTHRYDPGLLKEVPATVAKTVPTYTRHVLTWQDKSVACLDEDLLFSAFNRNLA